MIIRPAEIDDLINVFEWRNDPQTRIMSFENNEVSLDTHTRWYKKALVSEDCYIYIGLEDEEKIGVCRFDLSPHSQSCMISINFNPMFRGKGFAKSLLTSSITEFRKLHSLPISARIKKNNSASIKLFENCGFISSPASDDCLQYVYS